LTIGIIWEFVAKICNPSWKTLSLRNQIYRLLGHSGSVASLKFLRPQKITFAVALFFAVVNLFGACFVANVYYD
jgi:hypothetical protein